MKVLIIGSGGREHTLAWKIAQSPKLEKLYCAPGNPGIGEFAEILDIPISNIKQITDFACNNQIDLVVIGPEQALENGLTDSLAAAGIKVFGPSRLASRIETSKSFSKNFMQRHHIPTAKFAVFDDNIMAHDHVDKIDYPVVIKVSGLAAGKGVLIPDTKEKAHTYIDRLMVDRVFGSAAEEIVIEEQLAGEEVSLMTFCDGTHVIPMLPAQDHKRLLDRDGGPNTGGMGAYAPVSIMPSEEIDKAVKSVLQPAVTGLREEGFPYIGLLYAGLMITSEGPKVLEFNARFGDPETQVVLPLLETDILDIFMACVEGRLKEIDIRWKKGSAACVVMASAGYPDNPEKGKTIHLPQNLEEGSFIFQAGTRKKDGELLTAGGRVLAVTARNVSLPSAMKKVYRLVNQISFEGMQFRKDIGQREIRRFRKTSRRTTYQLSGVDIDAGNRSVQLMKESVRSTYNPRVLAGIGSFGGLYDAVDLKGMQEPVLVASTDGVGTKVKLAAKLNRLPSVGEDIVNHCIDDILVQGARPLFFMDYYASSQLKPEAAAAIVSGISKACRESHLVLLGGETAEMPGVYAPGEFDVAGTIVGVIEKSRILPRNDLAEGDVLIGFRSSGPHTNGFSLIRKIVEKEDLLVFRPELNSSLADALLAPHRSYLGLLIELIEQENSPVKALAHLTGGGFIENIPRVLPENLGAIIKKNSWKVPPLFQWLQKAGSVYEDEMYRVFNMGIGMVAVVSPDRVNEVGKLIKEEHWVIGSLSKNPENKVVLA